MSSSLLFISLIYINTVSSQWILSTSTLFREDDRFCVGVYNGTMYILGGKISSAQITAFDIDTQTFSDLGLNALSTDIYGEPQFWTQQHEILYMIQPSESSTDPLTLSIYNMATRQYTSNWKGFQLPILGDMSCLASNEYFLFVTGGLTTTTTTLLTILNLASYEWYDGPRRLELRYDETCIVCRGFLYSIGGKIDGSITAVNERIEISNIMQKSWGYTVSLLHRVKWMRSATNGEKIYIVGGRIPQLSDYYAPFVQVLDTTSMSISLLTEELPYPVSNPGACNNAVIIHQGILYSFGGSIYYSNSHTFASTDQWAYLYVGTAAPTMDPTAPSSSPSSNPTISTSEPTVSPSMEPSKYPTNNPTKAPSLSPSKIPTVAPTAMTSIPTDITRIPTDSTNDPSQIPSIIPSYAPSEAPSSIPSKAPSETPSRAPSVVLVMDTTDISDTSKRPKTSKYSESKTTEELPVELLAMFGVGLPVILAICYCIYNYREAIKSAVIRICNKDSEILAHVMNSKNDVQIAEPGMQIGEIDVEYPPNDVDDLDKDQKKKKKTKKNIMNPARDQRKRQDSELLYVNNSDNNKVTKTKTKGTDCDRTPNTKSATNNADVTSVT